ncbi:unnamed protein product [Cochlearia groenlandica]
MRLYLIASEGAERKIREERVKSSIAEVEKDPLLKKMVPRLEAPPLVTKELNKGKGFVFDFESSGYSSASENNQRIIPKLMGDAIKSGGFHGREYGQFSDGVLDEKGSTYVSSSFMEGSTVFRTGSFEPSSSGTFLKKKNIRKRPYKSRRKPRVSKPLALDKTELTEMEATRSLSVGQNKRKCEGVECPTQKTARTDLQEVVPKGGLPNV